MSIKQLNLARSICLALLAGSANTAVSQPIDLGILGDQGFRINGVNSGDRLGQSVALAGDVNGDGMVDLIVGASGADDGVMGPAGVAYVVFGQAGTQNIDLVALGTGGFYLNNAQRGDFSGYSVAGAGDVNGDGLDDLIVGQPGAQAYSGKAVVVFGKSDSRPVDLSDPGSDGFQIQTNSPGARLGFSVSGSGDVNGDGLADVVLGASYADPFGRNSAGEAYIVFGKTNARDVEVNALDDEGIVIQGATANDKTGRSVAGAGDVNGDGLADVIIGAQEADFQTEKGVSYVVFGQPEATTTDLANLALRGYRIGATGTNTIVSAAGDVNGDGLSDLLIGNRSTDGVGRAWVAFGKATSTDQNLSLRLPNSFRIIGDTLDGWLGSGIGPAGDINGDGLADVIVGASKASYLGPVRTGQAFLIFGKADSASVEVGSLGSHGLRLIGAADGDDAGRSVAGGVDVNGDGLSDIAIGAYDALNGSMGRTGAAYVVFSPETPPPTANYSSYISSGDAPPSQVGGEWANSRLWVDFQDGEGPQGGASQQQVTLMRSAGLFPEAGAGVAWEVMTDRIGWSSAQFTFHYTQDEVLASTEQALMLFHSSAASGPYIPLPTVVDPAAKTLSTVVSEAGFFFVGQTLAETIFENSFEESDP